MAYNTCDTAFRQTLFLGCSIASFSVSVGWNDQVGELTVELVEDECAVPLGGNPKVYWDHNLVRQETTDADPGFIHPSLGSPVYFRVGDFEWCGLIQSYDESRGSDGNPKYVVKLVDPRQVLENTQIIMGGYAGSVYGVPNLINVYGFTEKYGVSATLENYNGATFGSPAGYFGGSQSNSNGMPWQNIQGNLGVLLSSITPVSNMWSPYGRMVYRDGIGTLPGGSPDQNVGYGIIPGDAGGKSNYILDMSEMPESSPYWKIANQNASVLSVITEICQNASCDYYIELSPVWYDGNLYKVIKVRTVSRLAQPSLTAIDNFITLHGTSGVIRSSKGRELRNEPVSTVLVGGYQQGIYQAYQPVATFNDSDYITPYFGTDPLTGDAIIVEPTGVEGVGDTLLCFTVSNISLNQQLKVPLEGTTITIDEFELLSALGGYDLWLTNAYVRETDIYIKSNNATGKIGLYNMKRNEEVMFTEGASLPDDMVNSVLGPYADDITDVASEDLQTIFKFVQTYASEYYGKQFMVKLPYIAATIDTESSQIIVTDQPGDAAWADGDVLGLAPGSISLDFFSEDDGRIKSFSYLDISTSGVVYDSIDNESILITQNVDSQYNLYIQSEVLPDIVYRDLSERESPRAVVIIPNKIDIREPIDTSGTLSFLFNGPQTLAKDSGNKKAAEKGAKAVGGAALRLMFPRRAAMIEAAAVPLRSTVNTYGPWIANASSGSTFGGVRFSQDEGLTPWDYGGSTAMALAGKAKVFDEQYSTMQIAEMGSIEVDGYPTIPLGAELGSYDNGAFGAGTHLVEHRNATTGVAPVSTGGFVYIPSTGWTGLYGPNITSIDVQVGLNGVTTRYNMRTYTPSFGRYSRFNAERLKEEGLRNLKVQKELRKAKLQQARLASIASKQKVLYGSKSSQQAEGRVNKTDTPHSMLIAQTIPWREETSRSTVTTQSLLDAGKEFMADFNKKAMMSMDGLLRPVSIYGDGGLPRFASPTDSERFLQRGAMPPLIMKSGTVPTGNENLYQLAINNVHLNPLMSMVTHSGQMHGAATGHDITLLAHGSEPPSGDDSLNLYMRGSGIPKYAEDYRFLGLRGPLVMHSWGFDLDGKPVPNKSDTDTAASGGTFTTTGLQDTFLDNWLMKSHTWPVGPIDLRWDRERAVWTIPQYQPIVGEVITAGGIGMGGYGSGQIVGNYTLYDASGTQIVTTGDNKPIFRIQDSLYSSIPSGAKIYAQYNPKTKDYTAFSTNSRMIYGILQGNLEQGSYAIVDVCQIDTTGGYIDTGEDIAVHDWLLKAGQNITAGKRIIATLDISNGLFILQEAQC